MLEEITTEFIFGCALVFARLGTAFSFFPAIGDRNILVRGRLAMALTATLIIYPLIVPYLPKYSTSSMIYNFGILFIEMITGFIISIAAKCYFLCINTIGQIISMQSGLGSATLFDPAQRSQVAIFSNFLTMLTTTAIFVTDTHYLFIQSVIESYKRFPLGELLEISDMSKYITYIVNDSFILAFKISSPFLILSMLLLVGGGILSRLMPNFQVFFVITPAQILLMFATLYITINTMIDRIVLSIQDALRLTSF